jgi:hypothetical protein
VFKRAVNTAGMIRTGVALMVGLALFSAGAVAATVSKGSGEKMCVLTPADFRTFGTLVDSKPAVNIDDNGASVYCTYRGPSGARGGVELDVYYPAGASPDEVQNTWKATLGSDPGADYQPLGLPGVDESVYSLKVPQPGYFPFAANAVRRGDLVFAISLPSSPLSKTELSQLSLLVLQRLAK